jgi:ketosteroid isomerase-like protein
VSIEDVGVAERFRAALDAAFETGDRESVYAFFADDIEYTTPHRTLRGLNEVREKLEWGGGEPDNLDVEVEDGNWQDLGGGHVIGERRIVQRWKETGEVAAIMLVHVDLRIRDGKITRYERHGRPDSAS